jgi:ribonuclease PH
VQVLNDGGSILSCAINAVSLALMDAGVQATGVLSAVCLAAQEKKLQDPAKIADGAAADADESATHSYLLDPASSEEASSPTLTLAFSSTSPGVVLSVVERGSFAQAIFTDAVHIGKSACDHVRQFMRLSLERKHANA